MSGGLWSRKFDYDNGETRKCRVCDKDFHTMKPIWRCQPCTNEHVKNYYKSLKEEGKLNSGPLKGKDWKKPYPFSTRTNEAGKRFSKIRVALNKVWRTGDRELIRAHYAKQLKEAEDFGIIDWINDMRTTQSIREMTQRPFNKIKKDYPDTRGHYEE